MKKSIAIVLSAVALSALCLVGMAGCNGGSKQVAATVNGTEILEDTITNDITNMRMSNGLDNDEEWASYLSSYGYTPESIRESTIDSYVEKELIKKAAEENEVTVDDAEVQATIDQMKSQYDDEDAWKKALESVKLTEDEYRDNIKASMLQSALQDKVVEDAEPSKEDLLMYAQMYSAYTWNGAKKSSHILFASDDEKTAKEVLEQVKSGKLDFAEAAKQYSTDTGSAADGGNVGWDCQNQFVSEYTDGLKDLKRGEISDLVTSQFGIHIIKCTDVYNAPENLTSVKQVPSDLMDDLKSELADYEKGTKFDEWMNKYKEDQDIVVNPMPEGLPYYVELAGSSSSEVADDEAAAGDGSTGEAEGEEVELETMGDDDAKEESK